MGSRATGLHDLERGRAAFDERRWALAFKTLLRADDATSLTASDLCRLAWSAQFIGRHDDFASAMERAYHACLSEGDTATAVRCAFWIGFVHGTRGDLGPAAGWAERAGRLLGDRDGVERGYLLVPELMMGAMVGAWPAVHDLAAGAASIGERFGDADLTTFARHWSGRALVRMERVAEGFALLDEAMVAVVADEVSPFVSGLVYCSMIEACQEVLDLRRSQEWTRALAAWCDAQPDMIPFTGQCLVHRAELLVLHGAWEEAHNDANRAVVLAVQAGDRPAIANAHYVVGEVHRLRGEHGEALTAYESAHREGRDPQPGLALLRLAEGDAAGARATLQRACDESDDVLARANLLPALIETLVADGAASEARAVCAELATTANAFGSTVLAARVARGGATVDLLDGDPGRALVSLREAETVWRQLDAPYELALVYSTRSQACGAVGDADSAELDRRAALDVFATLGAADDLERLEASVTAVRDAPSLLTQRELEVLRLIATGSTNKARRVRTVGLMHDRVAPASHRSPSLSREAASAGIRSRACGSGDVGTLVANAYAADARERLEQFAENP